MVTGDVPGEKRAGVQVNEVKSHSSRYENDNADLVASRYVST